MTDRQGGLRAQPPLRGRSLSLRPRQRLSRSALDEQLLLSRLSVERCDFRHPNLLGDAGFRPSSPGFPLLGVGSTNQARPTNLGRHASAPNWHASGPSRLLVGSSHCGPGPNSSGCWIRAGGHRTRLCRTDLLPTSFGCACPATIPRYHASLLPLSRSSKGARPHWSRLLSPRTRPTLSPRPSSGRAWP